MEDEADRQSSREFQIKDSYKTNKLAKDNKRNVLCYN